MPNIAAVLKAEIARVARKEMRDEIASLKKQMLQQRSEITALKRRLFEVERVSRRHSKATSCAPARQSGSSIGTILRCRATGFVKHRQRLGLSAAQAGALVGVSGQTIYHWEAGKARPRASQLPRIDALRKLSKKSAAVALEQVAGS